MSYSDDDFYAEQNTMPYVVGSTIAGCMNVERYPTAEAALSVFEHQSCCISRDGDRVWVHIPEGFTQ